MNKKDAFKKGADAVAQPTAERLDEVTKVLKVAASQKDNQEFNDIAISNFEEINYRSLGLSKMTTLKDLSEDADVSIVLHLIDRYCSEEGFVSNPMVKTFLSSLHHMERNITTGKEMDYLAIDLTEESSECSKLLFAAVCICNELAEGKYCEESYDEIINNVRLTKSELESIPKTIKEKISIYPVKKWAYLLTGYDFESEIKLREEELEKKNLEKEFELIEEKKRIEETKKAQEVKEFEIREREKQLEFDMLQQGKLPLIREAIQKLVFEENAGRTATVFFDEKQLSDRVKKVLAKKISKGNTSPDEIRAFYTGTLFTSLWANSDLVYGVQWNGLIITDSLLCYKEAGAFSQTQYMSYKNMISAKKSGLYVVIKGRDGSKMKIHRRIALEPDVLISFVNEVIQIENE